MTTPEICIFDPKSKYSTGIYGFVVPGLDPGVLVCQFGGQTLDELKSQGLVSPEAFLCPWEEAQRLSQGLARQRYCTGPSRVTKERWQDMLEVMFPARWEQFEGGEMFMVPECITGTFYTFGVRIGEDHFLVTEDCTISGERLIKLCKECAGSAKEAEQ
ncbi:hypothetical protein UFOVP431_17 [uncultured Caudovirales phage]|uniref:Uncharacterized protein n=1 Tax=uncultured Caudovirales phage TaxID=2100421 RepID=A0A6J5MQ74_9CAUD|nr:hypothetical protein UFOVP431_17 [uncultured Caudovirales phage]